MASGLPSSGIHPWNTAPPAGSGYTVSCTQSATTSPPLPVTAGCYDITAYETDTSPPLTRTFTNFAVAASPSLKNYANKTWSSYLGNFAVTAGMVNSRLAHLPASQDTGGGLCPENWHPRGQDARYTIGPSTGRTLTSLNNETKAKTADAHWCRSDVRYTLRFKAQQHYACDISTCPPPGVPFCLLRAQIFLLTAARTATRP